MKNKVTTDHDRFVRRKMLHIYENPVQFCKDGWKFETVEREVLVMAIAEKYAMVRLPGCIPFVVNVSELFEIGA